MSAQTETEKRTDYIAGLYALAAALDNDPDLPLPYHGASSELLVFVDTKAEVVTYARLLHGKVDKVVTDDPNYGFTIRGTLAGLRVSVFAPRNEVCERVVVGTREVTREVPDPEALAAVPTTTVTEVVDDVVWECRPLLAPAESVVG